MNLITLPTGFHPDDAIWGYFWREGSSDTHYRSGFILYTNDGDYVVIRTDPYGSEAWECSQEVYSDLWGEGNVVGPVTVTRDINNPPFNRMFPTQDRFIAMVSPANAFQNTTQMAWSSTSTQEEIENVDTISVSSMPRAENLSSLSVENYGMNFKIKLYVNVTDSQGHVDTRYTNEVSFPFQGEDDIEFPNSALTKVTLSEIRSRHTRFYESDVIMDETPGVYLRAGQTNTGIPEILFGNMYSKPTSPGAQDLGALDIMLEYGVNQPPAECLFLTVQCHGRGSFFLGSFFPGDGVMGYDELMYTMGAALVHGIRGFNMYGLFFALCGGPTNPLPSVNRFPPELLYWGASVDGPNDVDMVTRVHEAVQTFTCVDGGNNTFFNLLDVLVDPDYEVMDSTEAVNANISFSGGSVTLAPDEPYLNFLALKEPDGDILVLLSTDGEGWTASECLVFPDGSWLEYSDYGEPEVLISEGVIDIDGGYIVHLYDPDGYYLMPQALNCSFALVRIPASGTDHQGRNTSAIIEQPRSLTFSRNTGSSILVEATGTEAMVYDLTGRVVERIAPGECHELSSHTHPAGVYFAVLSEEDTPLFIEKLVLLDGGR